MKLPKFSQTLLILIIAEIFTSLLIILYFNYSVPKQINTVPAIFPSPTSLEWKTYKNDQYGFEFQYPEGLKLNTGDNQIMLSNSRGDGGALNIYPDTNIDIPKFEMLQYQQCQQSEDLLGEGCPEFLISATGQLLPEVNQKTLNYIGQIYYRLSAPAVIDYDFYWWKKDRVIYVLSIPSSWNMSDQILSTFKFNNVPIKLSNGLYKFESSDKKISFEYPTNLKVTEKESRIDLTNKENENILSFLVGIPREEMLKFPKNQTADATSKFSKVQINSKTYNVLNDVYGEGFPSGNGNCFVGMTSTNYQVDIDSKVLAVFGYLVENECDDNGTPTATSNEKNFNLAKQILSTFKFTQ